MGNILERRPGGLPRLSGLLALGLLCTTACEKVVNLDLKTSDSQLVIEGNLADDGHPCLVTLSRSANYTDTNTFQAVSGAVLTLADNAGGLETLRESATTPGQYAGATLLGVPGRTYTLRVETGGAAYVAASTLPAPVVPFAKLSTQLSPVGNSNIHRKRRYALGDFVDTDILTFQRGSQPHVYLLDTFRNAQVEPRRVHTVSSISAMVQLVQGGFGVATLPRL
ncbi:MAG: DUF4249 family protein, partial [Cytophagaceae bacterium]